MADYSPEQIAEAKKIVEADLQARALFTKKQEIVSFIDLLRKSEANSNRFSMGILICLGWKREPKNRDQESPYFIKSPEGKSYIDISKSSTRGGTHAPDVSCNIHDAIFIIPAYLRVTITQDSTNNWKVQLYNNNDNTLVITVEKASNGKAIDIAKAICIALLELQLIRI